MHPEDAQRLGLQTGELVRVEPEIGYFIDRVWVTEGIKPGIIAMSHHLGRWKNMTRSALDHSPDGTRRPMWLKRPLKPVAEAYQLPVNPFRR